MYRANITPQDENSKTKVYSVICEITFKLWYASHKKWFNHRNTELSDEFYKLKDKTLTAHVAWEILGRHQSYNTSNKRSSLYLNKKLKITLHTNSNILNNPTEINADTEATTHYYPMAAKTKAEFPFKASVPHFKQNHFFSYVYIQNEIRLITFDEILWSNNENRFDNLDKLINSSPLNLLHFFPFFLSFFFNFFLLHSFQDFLKSFCKKNHSRYLFILPFFSARTFTFMTSLTTRACNEVLNNISLCNFLLKRKRCPRKKSPHPKFFVQFLWFFWVALKFLLCDNQKTITF